MYYARLRSSGPRALMWTMVKCISYGSNEGEMRLKAVAGGGAATELH